MWRPLLFVTFLSACGEAVDAGTDATTDAPEVDASPEVDTLPVDATEEVHEEVAVEVSETETRVETWRWEAGPRLPTVVQENAVLLVPGAAGDALWVLGGFENLQLVDRVRVLVAGATTWSDGPTLPRPLHHMNAAVVAGRVHILGSLEGFGFTATGDGWTLDPAAPTPTWTVTTGMPSARRRGSAGVAVVADDVYLVGGFRGAAVAEVDVFHSADATWTTGPSLPGVRDHGAAVALDGKVYYLGGRDTDITAVHGDLWVFDPASPEAGWVAKAPLPVARGGLAAAVYDGLIVVAGGEGNSAVASGVFADVEAYDPATDTWTVLPSLPTPRHGTGAVAFGGALWMPGGADVQAFGASDVVERLIRD